MNDTDRADLARAARDGTPGAVITDLLASLPAGPPPLSRRDRRRHK